MHSILNPWQLTEVLKSTVLGGKLSRRARHLLLLPALAVLLPAVSGATPLYWDMNGATAGAGGPSPSGTWDASTAFWTTDSLGTSTTTLWSAGNTAVFSAGSDATGSYTITLAGTESAAGITFKNGIATLSSGTLSLAGGNTIAVNAAPAKGIIASVITGNSGLLKQNSGELVLAGANTFSGNLTNQQGTLTINNSAAASSGSIVFNPVGANSAVLTSSNATISIGNNILLAGQTAATVEIDPGANNVITLSGVISGTHSWSDNGPGTLIFNGAVANTFSGAFIMKQGTAVITANGALGTSANGSVVNSGATLALTGGVNDVNAAPLSLNGTGVGYLGALQAFSGVNYFGGTITLSSDTTIGAEAGSELILGSPVSGSANLTITNTGTVALTGLADNYNDTLVASGKLEVDDPANAGTGLVTVQAGATLSGSGSAPGGVEVYGTIAPNGTFSSGGQNWYGGGKYVWEIGDAIYPAYNDLLDIGIGLTNHATAGNPFTIAITSLDPNTYETGPAGDFDNTAHYQWTIASTTNGIVGFNAADITLDSTAFASYQSMNNGSFRLLASATNLVLEFNPAPVLTTPASVTVSDGGNCSVTYASLTNTAVSNLGVSATAGNGVYGLASVVAYLGATPVTFPASFPVGVTSVTVIATDNVGNTITNNFNVKVTHDSTTTLAGPTTSTYGDSVTYTATVPNCTVPPTGTITFKDGSTTLSTVSLSLVGEAYQAALTTSAFVAGGHSITATYSGDDNYTTSTSLSVTLNVSKATPTVNLTVNNSPVTYDRTAKTAGVTIESQSVAGSLQNILVGGAASQTAAGTYAVTADFVPADTANFNTLLQVSVGNFVISKVTLTPTVTLNNKVYDGTTAATTIATRSLSGIVSGDDVTLGTSGTVAAFSSANVGDYEVSVTGLALSGTTAGNYVLSSDSTTAGASITKATVTPTVTLNNKVYDGTTAATTIATRSLSGIIGSDDVSLGASGTVADFSSANVNGYTVSITDLALTGTKAGNYVLSTTSTTASANITQATVTPTVTLNNKVYDGTTAATTIATRSLSGIVSGDDVSLGTSGTVALFSSANVGGYTISITDLALTGTTAGNYVLSAASTTASANIIQATVTPTVTLNSKVYDGTTAAATIASRSLSGVYNSDDVNLGTSGVVGVFSSKNVGSYTVDITGLELGGTAAANYVLSSASTTAGASILVRPLTVTAVTDSKQFDGTATSSQLPEITGSIQTGDSAEFTQSYDNPDVGTGKTLTASGSVSDGNNGNNYSVSFVPVNTGVITAAPVPTVVYVDTKYTGLAKDTFVNWPYTGAGSYIIGYNAFAKIQDGIGGVAAGGTNYVAAGIYPEALAATNPVTLLGAQYGQNVTARFGNFVSSKADATIESIITAAAVDLTAGNDSLHIATNYVTVDGFVFDGNNAALPQSGSSTVGGVATDVRRAVESEDAAGNLYSVNNAVIANNIIQNYDERGVEFSNPTNSSAATAGNIIAGNLISNFGKDGILLAFNAYADVTNNTVITPQFPAEAGIWVQDFETSADGGSTLNIISNNVTVGQDNFAGIWVNVIKTSGAEITVQGNTVNAAAGVVGSDDYTFGIYVSSLFGGQSVHLFGNIVGATGGQFSRGIALWNVPVEGENIIDGGSVGNSVKGVALYYNDPTFGDAQTSFTVALSRVTISGCTTGVFVDATDSTANTVLMRIYGLTVSSCATGVEVLGAYASADIQGYEELGVPPSGIYAAPTSQCLITGNAIGVDVNAAKARIQNVILTGNSTAAIQASYGATVDAGDCTDANITGMGRSWGYNNLTGYLDTAGTAKAVVNGNPDGSPAVFAEDDFYGATSSSDVFTTAISGTVYYSQVSDVVAAPAAVTVNHVADEPVAATDLPGFVAQGGYFSANVATVSSDDSSMPTHNGYFTRTYTVTDACGSAYHSDQTINVINTNPPTFTVTPSDVTYDADSGNCSKANVTWTVSATGAWGDTATVISTPASGSTFPVGATIVTNIATDIDGLMATNYFTVTIKSVAQVQVTTSSPSPTIPDPTGSTYGGLITFTATVPSCDIPATGTVTFKDGTAVLGTQTLDGTGSATLEVSSLTAGTHQITVVYSGDSLHEGNTSVILYQHVNRKALTVSGITADNKPYDGTTSAALNLGSAALVGVISGDNVTLNTGAAAGTFASAAAGDGQTVSISGLTISGTSADNYTLTQPTTTANITKVNVTITAQPQTITYGASVPPATTVTYSGFINGETNTVLTAQPITASAQSGVVAAGTYTGNYTASGAEAANYTFSYVAGDLIVQKATLVFSGLSVTPSTITYGTEYITVSGKLSASVSGGTVYPPQGDIVTVGIGGVWQSTTISDATGDFSMQFSSSTIPYINGSWAVNLGFNRGSTLDPNFTAIWNASKSLFVNAATPTVTVTGASEFTYNATAQGPSTYTTSTTDHGVATWVYAGVSTNFLGVANNYSSSTAPTNAGFYTATVSLASDTNNNAASSTAAAFTILQATNELVLSSSKNASTYGEDVIFTVTAQTNNGTELVTAGDVTGTAYFAVDGGIPVAQTITAGVATYDAGTGLTGGAHAITVTYSGDNNYATNDTALPLNQTVEKTTPTLTIVSATAIKYGLPLSASVITGAATNSITGNEVLGAFSFTYPNSTPTSTDSQDVTFTPYDTTDYNLASGSVTVAVSDPAILVQPVSITNVLGSNIVFSVTAAGTGTLHYQWYQNGTALPGATASNLVNSAIKDSDAGSYYVVVTNVNGTVTSSTATLTITHPPVFVLQPASQVANQGDTVTFSVSVNGATPFTYQWFKGGVALTDSANISGANGKKLILSSVTGSDAGDYSLLVTNVDGRATSTNATLTVIISPVINTQPASVTNNAGATVSFTVDNIGTTPAYRWYKNGTNLLSDGGKISGSTSATLTIANILGADSATYNVVISNSAALVVSSNATLVVIDPIITSQPVGLTNNIGTAANFSVTAYGTAPQYQWLKDGAVISGATATNYAIASVAGADTASYSVIVSNSFGMVTSTPAILLVIAPPVITQQPASRTNAVNTTATFTVTATGSTLTYTWYKNGTQLTDEGNVSGSTTSTLTLTAVTVADAASYTVVLTNALNKVTSLPAVLTVVYPPTITQQPVSITNNAGTVAAFTVVAGGSAAQYQWFKNVTNVLVNGGNVRGANAATLTLSNVFGIDAGNYSVVVSNLASTVASDAASLTVIDPVITGQPQGVTNIIGSAATFSVTVVGSSPLSYQWYQDGVLLDGETSSTMTLPSIADSDAGHYLVIATNIYGSVTSTPAILVTVPPLIVTQPASISALVGDSVNFSVGVNGATPFTYQWQENGTNISGATNRILTFASVVVTNAGSYRVYVTNPSGTELSESATLSVYTSTVPAMAITYSAHVGAISVTGVPGFTYAIQSSTNLVNWVSFQTNTSPFTVSVTNNAALGSLFYRGLYLHE